MNAITKIIIERCKQHGYKLDSMKEDTFNSKVDLWFKNPNVREELQMFEVVIDKDLEEVRMAIIMDLGSWNEALNADLNNIEEVQSTIDLWISKENLEEAEKWLED